MWAQRWGPGLWNIVAGAKPRSGSVAFSWSLCPWSVPFPPTSRVHGGGAGGVARFQCLIRGVSKPSISREHNGTALSTADHR